MYTVYDHMYGDFPVKNTVHTPYIRMYVWFWPTLCADVYMCVPFPMHLLRHVRPDTQAASVGSGLDRLASNNIFCNCCVCVRVCVCCRLYGLHLWHHFLAHTFQKGHEQGRGALQASFVLCTLYALSLGTHVSERT